MTLETKNTKRSYRIDLSGRRFRNAVVVERSSEKNKHGIWMWVCLCDCGKKFLATGNNLQRRPNKHCGCMTLLNIAKANQKRKKDPTMLMIGDVFRAYKQGARRRGFSFELSLDNFGKLILGRCFYCDSPPKLEYTPDKKPAGVYRNGVDRMNSNEGYTVENSVTCCFGCNLRKSDMDFSDFMTWVIHVSERFTEEDKDEYIDAIQGDAVRQYLMSIGKEDESIAYKTPLETEVARWESTMKYSRQMGGDVMVYEVMEKQDVSTTVG